MALLGTNIFPSKALLKMMIPFPKLGYNLTLSTCVTSFSLSTPQLLQHRLCQGGWRVRHPSLYELFIPKCNVAPLQTTVDPPKKETLFWKMMSEKGVICVHFSCLRYYMATCHGNMSWWVESPSEQNATTSTTTTSTVPLHLLIVRCMLLTWSSVHASACGCWWGWLFTKYLMRS